ncbi:MAG: hypothetical protein MI741_23025 [Rhodospirillales bacterium]|nr:hypothetical protein [Rhodospirillales bacterium]
MAEGKAAGQAGEPEPEGAGPWDPAAFVQKRSAEAKAHVAQKLQNQFVNSIRRETLTMA